jgi:hypothetical protein
MAEEQNDLIVVGAGKQSLLLESAQISHVLC